MPTGSCPWCRKESDVSPANEFRPFCCERCRVLDLGGWLSGAYALPGDPVDLESLGEGESDDGEPH